MKFDQLDNQPCLLPQVNEESCESTRLPVQEGRLELRPEVAVVAVLGTVQYRTFLIANGVEREVTSGLSYRSGSTVIAVIGAIGGNATGISVGIVTISVEWQGLEAFGQLQVVDSCDNISNGLEIVIDNSESMNQAFGAPYGTKLDFAKFLAKQFAGEVDVRKDIVGLTTFAVSGQVVAPLTADNIAVGTAIMGVGFVPEQTDIHAGLETAIAELAAANVDRRVILLITDGQHNDDIEPLQTALQFRSGGGVLIVIGLRAGLEAFMRLEKLANGGFFISAYDGPTAEDAKRYVSGLKGYLCAGNCCPEGDIIVGQGKLNYEDWLNWDNIGNVDLIGNGFYDLIPGHGLFVDLVGSSAPWQGGLISKKSFTFQNGVNYKLSYKLAGNQRADATGYSVKVNAGGVATATHAMNDWRQDFTTYDLSFLGDGTSGQLIFIQETVSPAPAAQAFGVLLDDVTLINDDTDEILFTESFDNENLTYVPPACGMGTVYGQGYGGGYAYGTCCYGYGCLAEPVKQQNPDPMPPTDPETEPDPFWISTQSYTASCPVGTTGADVTRSASYKSFISAADANAKALALAQTAAEAALNCVSPPVNGDLINMHAIRGRHTTKIGFAAFGKTSGDVWNAWSASDYNNDTLLKSDGTASFVTIRKCEVGDFTQTDLVAVNFDVSLDHPDAMYKMGQAFYRNDSITPKDEALFFDGLPEGNYEVYVYGHGADNALQVGHYQVRTGKLTGDLASGFVLDPFTNTVYPTLDTSNTDSYLDTAWAENVQFVKYSVTIGAGQTGICIISASASGVDPGRISVLMGVQIHRVP